MVCWGNTTGVLRKPGLVFKAHRWLYHSTLVSRVMKKKKKKKKTKALPDSIWSPQNEGTRRRLPGWGVWYKFVRFSSGHGQPERLVFYCRTTSASTAPCTSRRMCCPTRCASYWAQSAIRVATRLLLPYVFGPRALFSLTTPPVIIRGGPVISRD